MPEGITKSNHEWENVECFDWKPLHFLKKLVILILSDTTQLSDPIIFVTRGAINNALRVGIFLDPLPDIDNAIVGKVEQT